MRSLWILLIFSVFSGRFFLIGYDACIGKIWTNDINDREVVVWH